MPVSCRSFWWLILVAGISLVLFNRDGCERSRESRPSSLQHPFPWSNIPAKRSRSSRYNIRHALFTRPNDIDIIEECLTLFRANCLFRNFEIKGPADRTLIYGILFISDCLNKLGSRPSQNQQEAGKALNALALENFNIPGEPGFPLNPLFASPANRNDAGTYNPLTGNVNCVCRFVETVFKSI
jgi:ARP2/3 complex ARPC3 (21 kDa) subunit